MSNKPGHEVEPEGFDWYVFIAGASQIALLVALAVIGWVSRG